MTTLGGEAKPLKKTKPPLKILLVGLQGSGKTTTAAKLASLERTGQEAFVDCGRPPAAGCD